MNPTDVIQQKTDTWNAQDRAGYLALFTDDFELITPDATSRGRQAAIDFWDVNHRAVPDSTVKAECVYVAGDVAVVEWVTDGINTGPLAGPDGADIPPSGRRVSLQAAGIYTIRDGRIARTRYYWDNVSFLSQLGLM